MAKLKNIIKQLSEPDYEAIHSQLIESNAEKSAYLLKSMREKQMSDNKVMDELEVNTNAYYTLRSRLNQKIEEYLLQQMENPRTDILKKVANINEILFTKKKAIAIATLKKLEKELLDYDLSNELTVVYKSLKKLHINSPDHFNYSQLYNQHVAYMLAVDKAEDLLAEYFKKYGHYTLSGSENDKLELTLLNREMSNVCGLYDSHRLYVYQSCMNIFHRMFVEVDESIDDDLEPIEDILDNIEKIFNSYHLDSIYYHLKLVYEFLKLEYYNHYKVYRKAENFFEEVNEAAGNLMSNYSLFSYPPQFLLTKIKRHNRLGNEVEMYEENELLFQDFECDKNDIPKYVTYVTYRAMSCYYSDKPDEAARWINNLLNEISLKNFPYAQLEVKVILALQYCLMNDYDLFNQLINSIQRQIRLLGKDNCEHILIFTKILKTSINDVKKNKSDKIRALVEKMKNVNVNYFAPTLYVKLDEKFINKLS
ncbi:hypothetical protein QQ020_27545 [Fulvivirgaceae bacterium BMA12]|uniref:Uncharacterized protein n=1 Tax=Agaribacillus aureus TaxID=3051825 RepID=A0ABT8LDK8_9BACT|nr:hypothetical protein [Fulvivirgaceae bacterium BMA12]